MICNVCYLPETYASLTVVISSVYVIGKDTGQISGNE